MKWRVVAGLIAAGLVLLVVVLLFVSPVHPAEAGIVVKIARSEDSKTLDPQDTSSGEDVLVCNSLFETLVRFRDGGVDLEPGLAEAWEALNDGRVWEFELRENVTFHDGTPFDAEAVVFSFNRLLGIPPGNPYTPKNRPYLSNYRNIQSVEALSQRRVRFTLKKPSAVFLRNLAMFPAAIVSPAAVRADPENFGNRPVGTGPMRFVEWRKGTKIVLEKFPGYWGRDLPDRRARADRIVFIPVRDPQARISKLRTGEAHVAMNLGLADIRKAQETGSVNLDFAVSMNVAYLGFNLRARPYNDVNFRRAVAFALDRRQLIDRAYYGLADPAQSICPPSIFRADVAEPTYSRDLEKAKRLLAGVDLKGVEIVLWVPEISRPYMPEPDRIAIAIKDDLEEIGLKVRLERKPWSIYLNETKNEDHPMFLLGWSTDNADPDNFYYALLHGASIPGTNRSFFDHPEFNRLVEQARVETDEARRRELYNRAEKIFREELPVLPLVHVRQAVAFARNVNYRMHPIETRAYQVEILQEPRK